MVVKLRPFICLLGATAVLAHAQTAPSPIAPPPIVPIAPAGPVPIDPPVVDSAATTTAAPGANVMVAPLESTNGSGITPSTVRTNEFQGDDISLVLRTLARQAKMNIVVSEKIIGTVTLRLEDRTARQAIETIVRAKGLAMEEADGIFYIKTLEEQAKEPTESGSYTLSYAKAEDVTRLLKEQLSSGLAPQFDIRTNTVFYREGRSNIEAIKLFLNSIDKPTQQVMIEARLVEVTANPRQSYGINWNGVLDGTQLTYGGSPFNQATTSTSANGTTTGGVGTGSTSSNGSTSNTGSTIVSQAGDFLLRGSGSNLFSSLAGQFAILSAPQLSVALSLINNDGDAEFLANPRVVTANNQKAEIKIVTAQPVVKLQFNEQTASTTFSGFEEKEYGNTLVVTPTINKDRFISLSVKPEISNKTGDVAFVVAPGSAPILSPIIDKRTLDSNVLIKSGDTLAIGGLLQDEVIKTRTKVPFLGDIPVVGYAFSSRENVRRKRNLLVFVTPTIIQQGYGTGLESQVSGLTHAGEEFADPNGWRNNARGAVRIVPTSARQVAADYPKPGVAPAPKKRSSRRAD